MLHVVFVCCLLSGVLCLLLLLLSSHACVRLSCRVYALSPMNCFVCLVSVVDLCMMSLVCCLRRLYLLCCSLSLLVFGLLLLITTYVYVQDYSFG